VIALLAGLGVVAWRVKGGAGARVDIAQASGAASAAGAPAPTSSAPAAPAAPNGASYTRLSQVVEHLEAGAQVLDGKIDRSLFEIDPLAAKLGSNPAVIFQFVRDQIRVEPYPGVLRGGLGTLICRSGNSLDRSLLLAALLQKAGLSARIARGTLSAQSAAALVARLFEPVQPLPAAAPPFDSLAQALGEALGVAPGVLHRLEQQDSARDAAEAAERWTYVDGETKSLSDLLAKSAASPSAITPRDRLIADASDHFWVQYKNSAGDWVDLDPAFADAQPGKAFAPVTTTFAPDAVPEGLYHYLRVRLTLRVAQTTDDKDGATNDRVLLDHELRVADQQGVGITVANAPQQAPDLSKVNGTIADALTPVTGYQTVLQIGSQVIPGLSFDLSGQLSGIGVPEAADVKQAGGVGAVAGGIAGGINGAFGGAPAQASGSRIVGEWVDYTVTSPGANGQAPEMHTYHRDIVPPTAITSWSARDPNHPTTIATKLGNDALRERLLWSAEVLPVTGTANQEYAGYLAITSLIAQHATLDESIKRETGQPVEESNPPPPTATVGSVDLASYVMRLSNVGRAAPYPALRSYFARPGLIEYETTILDAGDKPALIKRFDIITYAPRVVANPAAALADVRDQAASLHVTHGVLATRLEAELMTLPKNGAAAPSPEFNTTRVFSAAAAQRVPVVVLQPTYGGAKVLASLSAPDSIKAELSQDLAAGQTLIVPSRPVTVDGLPQIGWWRVDETSGEVIGVMPGERGQETVEDVIIHGLIVFNRYYCFFGAGYAKSLNKLLYCTVAMVSGSGPAGLGLLSTGGTVIAQGVGALYSFAIYALQ
jgi:transglutaminase-like putative cysteine protease